MCRKQPRGIFRFLSWRFLADISLPCNLIFASHFTFLLVWPNLAMVYNSNDSVWGKANVQITDEPYPDRMLRLQDSWPFDNESMVKWFWSPFVIGAFNLSDFIGKYIPSIKDWAKFFPLWVCRIISSARGGIGMTTKTKFKFWQCRENVFQNLNFIFAIFIQ